MEEVQSMKEMCSLEVYLFVIVVVVEVVVVVVKVGAMSQLLISGFASVNRFNLENPF